jgi:hypothetical protein
MHPYDSTLFDPPAPVARATIRNPNNGAEESGVPMLLDTGADVTLIPEAYTKAIDIDSSSGERFELEGFDGSRCTIQAAQLEMIFLGKTFRGKFLVQDRECGVIGRDILNLLSLSLDGPSLSWGESVRV